LNVLLRTNGTKSFTDVTKYLSSAQLQEQISANWEWWADLYDKQTP